VKSGAGAVCAEGSVNLGPLGSGKGSADFALDLRLPTVEARVDNVTPFNVGVGARASESFGKAWFSALGFDFSLITPSIATITPDVITKMIEDALKFNFSLDALLHRKITVSLLPSSDGQEGDPQPDGGGVNGGEGQPGSGQPSAGGGEPETGRTQPGMETGGKRADNQNGGGSQQSPWAPGPYTVKFQPSATDPNLFTRQYYSADNILRQTDRWLLHRSKVDVLQDSSIFPYPDFVRSRAVTAADREGRRARREYQLFAAPISGAHSCPSGVCVMRLGPEDDGNQTLRDIAGLAYLPLVFGKNDTPYDGFRTLAPRGRAAQFGVLADLVQAAWEPETFGTLNGVTCVTDENPCTRLVVAASNQAGRRMIIHSDKAAAGSPFDRPIRAVEGSLLWAALGQSDHSPWILDTIDEKTVVNVLQSDADSFLILTNSDQPGAAAGAVFMVYTPGKGMGHSVEISTDGLGIRPLIRRWHSPGDTLANSSDAILRNVLALLKARQSGSAPFPATISADRSTAFYRENGSPDATLAVVSGNPQKACLRQASIGAIADKWKQWNAAGEAPPVPQGADATGAAIQRLLLDKQATWRSEGFARNPMLLLAAQDTADSKCNN
jgi:hypothetical protein